MNVYLRYVSFVPRCKGCLSCGGTMWKCSGMAVVKSELCLLDWQNDYLTKLTQ